jgi:hypothetical protein
VYGEIRHHLAHNKGAPEALEALLAKTNIEEMKMMFGFLHVLHEAMRELHLNGRSPLPLPNVAFALPPDPKPSRLYHPGEKSYREAQDALLSMSVSGFPKSPAQLPSRSPTVQRLSRAIVLHALGLMIQRSRAP